MQMILTRSVGLTLIMLAIPLAIVATIAGAVLPLPTRSASSVVDDLRAFLDGTGDGHDWDAFISVRISDPRLDAIRERASALDLPIADYERSVLQGLLAEAEAIMREQVG